MAPDCQVCRSIPPGLRSYSHTPSRYNGCHHLRCFRRRGPPGLRRQDRVPPRPRGRPRGAQARVRGDLRLGRGDLPPRGPLHLHRKCPRDNPPRDPRRTTRRKRVSRRPRASTAPPTRVACARADDDRRRCHGKKTLRIATATREISHRAIGARPDAPADRSTLDSSPNLRPPVSRSPRSPPSPRTVTPPTSGVPPPTPPVRARETQKVTTGTGARDNLDRSASDRVYLNRRARASRVVARAVHGRDVAVEHARDARRTSRSRARVARRAPVPDSARARFVSARLGVISSRFPQKSERSSFPFADISFRFRRVSRHQASSPTPAMATRSCSPRSTTPPASAPTPTATRTSRTTSTPCPTSR